MTELHGVHLRDSDIAVAVYGIKQKLGYDSIIISGKSGDGYSDAISLVTYTSD